MKWVALIPFLFAAIAPLAWLFRPLWFDEALTVMEFMPLENPADIYWRYNIPNNHILFTLLLRAWNELTMMTGLTGDFILRGLPLLINAAAFLVSFRIWKRRGGFMAATLILMVFVVSRPFEIYSMALRGYMLSFLLVTLGLECFRRWNETRKLRYCSWFFMIALAALATMPSNLLAFAAIALFFLPEKFREIFRPKFLLPALLPVVAFFCVYLPIWHKLMRNLALKEGWHDAFRAVLIVYSGWVYATLPLLLVAAIGMVWCLRGHRFNFNYAGRVMIFLLPLMLWPVMRPYPFPRVFFSIWPVWLMLVLVGLRPVMSVIRRRWGWYRAGLMLMGLITMSCIWGVITRNLAPEASKVIVANKGLDDYFWPYYIDIGNYSPEATIRAVKKDSSPVYASFSADRYPLMYYGWLRGMEPSRWQFDIPGRIQLQTLPEGCLVILSSSEPPEITAARFHGTLTLWKENGYHYIYRFYAAKP